MIKQIKVGSAVFKVKEDAEISNTEDLWGRIQFESREIFVKKGMCESQKAQTLMHEIVHAAEREIALGLDEKDTERFSRMLIQVIRDNPKLIEMVMKS